MTHVVLAAPYNETELAKIKSTDHNQTHFSFVVMGDNRDGDRIFQKIIARTNREQNLSFLIDNGDLVPYGREAEYRNYFDMIQASTHPIISIIGNHEIPLHGRKRYKQMFGKTSFAFAYGNSYFIILDSAKKRVGHKKMAWLRRELQHAQHYTHRFVLTHVPLYDPRKGAYARGHSFKDLDNARKVNDILDRYHVTMLFASHIHYYHRGQWHQTPYIITGGAGAPLKHYSRDGFYHYIRVVVEGANVRYEVVKISQ